MCIGVNTRVATNVSNSSRLVKAVLQSNSPSVTPSLPADNQKNLILPLTQEQQKMDVDVEMKSLNTTPTKSQTLKLTTEAQQTPSSNVMLTDGPSDEKSPSNKITCHTSTAAKDTDSGIENMETSEQTSPVNTPQKESSMELIQQSPKSLDERLEAMLSKILNATWNEYCTGSMICPQTASFLEKFPAKRFDFESLISNVLMECVLRIYNCEETVADSTTAASDANNDEEMKADSVGAAADADKKPDNTPTYSTPKKIKSDDSEVQEILANAVDDQPSTSRGLQSGKLRLVRLV